MAGVVYRRINIEALAEDSTDRVRLTTKTLLEQRALAREGAVVADSVELDEDVAGALAVQIIGNQKAIDKPSLTKYITSLLK